nr:Dabb family protein [Flexithrix dorotheae]
MGTDTNTEANSTTELKPQKLLRHVVLMKFKDDTTEEQLKAITDAFGELPSKIKEIHDFEWGTDVSPENLQQGFTHCFFVTFKDAKARDIYLPHPAHKAFVDLASPSIDKVCVVDYFTKN